jgi:hypothetical protein
MRRHAASPDAPDASPHDGDARAAGAAARRARVAALFSASGGGGGAARVDLGALVDARSLDGAGRGRAPLNGRFAFATVQGTCQSNRRGQVAAMWHAQDAQLESAASDRGGAGSVADVALTDEAWEARRREAAARESARQAERAAGACLREGWREKEKRVRAALLALTR